VRALLTGLGFLLAAGAAGGAALIVLPAPSQSLALAAIVASERSLFIVVGAILALILVVAGLAPATRMLAAVAVLLSIVAIGIGVVPLAQARRLARDRGVALDFGRYLAARIDTEGPGAPDQMVEYARIPGPPVLNHRESTPTNNDRHLDLDVYLPAKRPSSPGRAVLVVHGGFWSAGQMGEAAIASRRLAELGFTVFDVDYRTAPQPNWREAVGDLKCAIGWVKAHASHTEWNVDPTKIALLGRSAGAHLALMAAYTASERDLPPSCPTGDTSVEAVVSLYAPTDLVWGYDHPGNPRAAEARDRMRAFLGEPPDRALERWRALSPVARVTARAPRTLLVHGGRDQMVPREHLDLLVAKLREHAVAFDTLVIPYAQHAFDFVVGGYSSQLLEATLLQFLGSGH
jgi:acetyl esterase/lipase